MMDVLLGRAAITMPLAAHSVCLNSTPQTRSVAGSFHSNSQNHHPSPHMSLTHAACWLVAAQSPHPCRAVASPSDPAKPLQSASSPLLQLSGTTGVGPCVLGARVGGDTSTGRLSSWALGLNYNRMTAEGGTGGVERLNGQQVG